MPLARTVLVPLLATGLAFAAPVPKDTETPAKKLERLFGTPSQPEGTKVELVGNVLRIAVPELPAGKPGEADTLESPRTSKAVTGDFELTVVISTPKTDGPVDSWAGVHVAFDGTSHFDYMRWLNAATRRSWSQLRTAKGQSNTVGHAEPNDATSATIRIVRKGNDLTAHARYGKGEWTNEAKATAELPAEVTVGVYVGGRKGPFVAEFEEFTVKPLR